MIFKRTQKRCRKNHRRTVVAVRLVTLLFLGFLMAGKGLGETEEFRIALARNILPEVRDSDTVASIMVWGDEVFASADLDIKTVPSMIRDAASIKTLLEQEQTELVALMTSDFFGMQNLLALDRILAYSARGNIFKEYVLLVRRDSGLAELASLRGKSLVFGAYERQSMGWIWLDTLLMKEQEQRVDGFFRSSSVLPKNSRAVLNVFFGKADVCLSTRSAFETMVELNPQIGKTLMPILVSPGFVPSLLCMRKSYALPHLNELYEAVKNIEKNPKGAQILTVFGFDGLDPATVEDLASVREWMDMHTVLKKKSANKLTGGTE